MMKCYVYRQRNRCVIDVQYDCRTEVSGMIKKTETASLTVNVLCLRKGSQHYWLCQEYSYHKTNYQNPIIIVPMNVPVIIDNVRNPFSETA